MAHARLTQARMFDWIRACLDTGAALPTDCDIIDQFNLPSLVSARSLLADLADRGDISIKGIGADRVITLGRKHTAPAPIERPIPSVVKRTEAGKRAEPEQIAFDKIKAALARGRAAVAPADPPPAPTPVSTAAGSPDLGQPVVEGAQPIPLPVEAAPQRKPKLAMVRLPTKNKGCGRGRYARNPIAGRDNRRQLNLHIDEATFAEINRRGALIGESTAAHARALVMDALAGNGPVSNVKPLVPAAITAAAIRDGVPVVAFVAMLLARGLATYELDAARERAA